MNKLQLLRYSYSSRLQTYWNNLSVKIQQVLLLTVFTFYSLVCFFIVKTSFSSKLTSDSQEKQNNIRPVKYLLEKQKVKSKSTIKIKSYESQSNR
ncbi:hypothetical protein SAMN04488018_11323 [Myroides marinus]|uniref:Uncharacterized protein n=1 Tax=Myroides marinus TaxID=703342 RepID=A0A1H6WKP0_9FLAO|nr:hypothetical protein HMPREF9711_02733 [Myroides odoratimimus CCUG 3837]SEJ12935.1 hypothetical protein SAMN04488018_11323 [Myroides marinus]